MNFENDIEQFVDQLISARCSKYKDAAIREQNQVILQKVCNNVLEKLTRDLVKSLGTYVLPGMQSQYKEYVENIDMIKNQMIATDCGKKGSKELIIENTEVNYIY